MERPVQILSEKTRSVRTLLQKNVSREHSYCMTSREALDNPEEKLEGSEEDLTSSEDGLDWRRGPEATQTCLLEPQRKVVTSGKALLDPLPTGRGKRLIQGARKVKFKSENNKRTERHYNEVYVDENARGPHQFELASSVNEEEGKSGDSLEGRRVNKGDKNCCPANGIETMKTHHGKVYPSQARVLCSQEKNINQQVLEGNRTAVLKCPTSVESHYEQQRVSERGPSGNDSSYGISLREDFEGGSTLGEKSHYINQEGEFRRLLPSTWRKFPGTGRQLMEKESSRASRTTYDQQLWNYRKRKTSGDDSAFYIVPKQVKLATASLLDNGESSHPSVGSVIVECIPPSNETKKDNRTPFFELQNRDAPLRSSNTSFQSAIDVGVVVPDKENISRGPDTAPDCPSSAGVRVRLIQNSEVISSVLNVRQGFSLAAKVSCSRTLDDTSWGHSVHSPRRSGSKTLYSSGLRYGSPVLPQKHRQLLPTNIPGACSGNEDIETHHEIAGITMQRRSWEALKSTEAEYFAKRRYDPKMEATSNGSYLPFIPSRFKNAACPTQKVSGAKPAVNFETDSRGLGVTLSRPIGVTAHASVAERRMTHTRGPNQGKQERLSTKVLNRNLEHFVQLNDASCHRVNAFSRLNHALQGADLPVDVSQFQPSRSYSGLPKLPSLKTRQRRGPKKFDKERLKIVSTKSTSSTCHFKLLSESSGLLGDLNPGIIGRVRNTKQIHAILGALIGVASRDEGRKVRPPQVEEIRVEVQEILNEENGPRLEDGGPQHLTMGRSIESEQMQENKVREETQDQGQPFLSNAEQCQSLTRASREAFPECAATLASRIDNSVNGDDLHEPLRHMKSSLSGDPEYVEGDNDEELQPISVTDSSSAAAGLAARWLELLSLDAEGRLLALRRSRRRVQSTLLSGPLNPEKESAVDPASTRSAIDMDVLGSQQSVCSDAATILTKQDESLRQVDRWRALFSNMDVVLGNEATKLESCLWQIKQMQSFCPRSTPQPCCDPEKLNAGPCEGPAPNPEVEGQPVQRWPLTIDATGKELGFAASAASIMSTANFVTRIHNFR